MEPTRGTHGSWMHLLLLLASVSASLSVVSSSLTNDADGLDLVEGVKQVPETTTRSRRLNQFIRHYEPLNYDRETLGARVKRSADEANAALRGSSYFGSPNHREARDRRLIPLDFSAHGHHFRLRLRPDLDSVFAPGVIIEGPEGERYHDELDLHSLFVIHDHDAVRDRPIAATTKSPSTSSTSQDSSSSSSNHDLDDFSVLSDLPSTLSLSQLLTSSSSASTTTTSARHGPNSSLPFPTTSTPLIQQASSSSSSSSSPSPLPPPHHHPDPPPDSHVLESVYGSLRDGLFQGKIRMKDGTTFYVESAAKYRKDLHNSTRYQHEDSGDDSTPEDLEDLDFHSLIYSSDDVEFDYSHLHHGRPHTTVPPTAAPTSATSKCAHEDESIRRWMNEVSTSAVDNLPSHPKNLAKNAEAVPQRRNNHSSATESHVRSKRWDQDLNNWYQQPRISKESFSAGTHSNYPPFDPYTIKRRACSLYIQTDTYLWEHIKKHESSDAKAREEIASLVAQHIKAVNDIYESSDFNGIRGLKFIVQRLKINDSSACDHRDKRDMNPFCSSNIDVSNFLNLNSQFNHNDFCLAYIFTYRDFSGGTLGLAWVASTNGVSGGICEKYKSYTESINGRSVQTKRSLNTGIITFVNYNSRVPPKVSELTLAHEIGHNFGSPHDYPMECRPGGAQGNFIMYSSATSGERSNNNKFSPCSIRNISAVLHAVFAGEGKDNCFQEDDGPFCGNKIVEEGEECDCGYDEKECTEQCCYPREVQHYIQTEPWAVACTRRRGALCSPSEGPCCTETCEYEDSNKLCRGQSECTHEAYCTGRMAHCANSSPRPNKTECNGGTQVCWSGQCVGSICQKYGLEECFLTSKSGAKPDEMCEVACQNPDLAGSCMATSEIHHMRNVSGLRLRPGSPCNDYQGYCDVFQRCRAVDADGPLARLKSLLLSHRTLMTIKQLVTTYWWACMLLIVLVMLIMALFIKCCAVHTPSSNPKKRPALRLSDTLRRPADTLRRKRNRSSQSRSASHSRGESGHRSGGGGAGDRGHASSSSSRTTATAANSHRHAGGSGGGGTSHQSRRGAAGSGSSNSSSSTSVPTSSAGDAGASGAGGARSRHEAGSHLHAHQAQLHGSSSSGNSSGGGGQHFQMQPTGSSMIGLSNPLLAPASSLIVAMPPETGNTMSTPLTSAPPIPHDPPPPYPGILMPSSSSSSGATPAATGATLGPQPSAPPLVPSIVGPSHGYGKGRGHYNREGNANVPTGKTVVTSSAAGGSGGSGAVAANKKKDTKHKR